MPKFDFTASALVGCLSLLASLAAGSSAAFAQTAGVVDGTNMQTLRVAAPRRVAYEAGIASTYGEGDGFEGNLTACGKVFHTGVVQVAHKTLPCGTMIRIEDADTGRSIDAEVTDRGPYIPGRVVDLSWAAFRELEPSGPGLLNVTLYLLDT